MTTMGAEVLIRGSGPVALACALFLARHWPDAGAIAVADGADAGADAWTDAVPAGSRAPATTDVAAAATPAAALAARPLAISAGSRRLIERVADFPAASGAIRTVEVALAGHPGRVRMHASEHRLTRLGDVVRHGDLVRALSAALARTGVRHVARDLVAAEGTVLIHADGDPGRDGYEADARDFDQAALLAEVELGGLEAGTALERFTAEGPLALLPLPEPGRWALVWCGPPNRTQAHARLDDTALAARLRDALGPRFTVGRIDARVVVPLRRRARLRPVGVDPRRPEAWIGNAAQALHPVAGQGLNLGLRDAHALAGALARWRHGAPGPHGRPVRDALDALHDYAQGRRPDRDATIRTTDWLATGLTRPLAAPVQSAALALLDLCGPLRRPLARHFAF